MCGLTMGIESDGKLSIISFDVVGLSLWDQRKRCFGGELQI